MDNVTHGLFGLGIYGVWAAADPLQAHTGLATGVLVAAVLGSEAPDFDYVVRIAAGPVKYLRHHRALSHSLPFWFIWPGAITLDLSARYPGHGWLLFLIAMTGVLLHVGVDLLTTYGTQACWPLTGRRLAYDSLFIVDIVLWGIGFACVWAAARTGRPGQAAVWGWIAAAVYVAGRVSHSAWLRRRVRQAFGTGWSVSVLPGPLPWMWSFVAQSPERLVAGRVSNGGHLTVEAAWDQPQPPSAAAEFALQHTDVGQVFAWFARHLMWRERVSGDEIHIWMTDATYRYGQRFPFAARVVVRRNSEGGFLVLDASLGRSATADQFSQ
ncbi:MAG: metal-dependent hydrolase [Alicyclobacillus sp.]|nr:metal-dependent hydrolase [Alicyclobacillus sp.]